MRVPAATLCVLCACAIAACGGGDDGPKDSHVADGVKGSGEQQLLRDDGFKRAVRDVGVSPSIRPAARLGRAIGRRVRLIVTDSGRIAPGSFQPGAYRNRLYRLGRLTRSQFTRRFGEGPLEMANRVGILTGQLESRLDENADPGPDLPRAVFAGFGRIPGEHPDPHRQAAGFSAGLAGLFPEAERLQCATHYKSSYVFAARVYASN